MFGGAFVMWNVKSAPVVHNFCIFVYSERKVASPIVFLQSSILLIEAAYAAQFVFI